MNLSVISKSVDQWINLCRDLSRVSIISLKKQIRQNNGFLNSVLTRILQNSMEFNNLIPAELKNSVKFRNSAGHSRLVPSLVNTK